MIKAIIADDEFLERKVFKVLISRYFKEIELVAEAENGRQAIELFDIHRPELIIMDVKMPGIDGIEAIEEIRKRSSRTKFIIVSAYNFFDYAKRALKYGIEDYLLKPVTNEEYITVIGNVIKNIKNEREISRENLEIKEKFKSMLPILEMEVAVAIMLGDIKKIKQYTSLMNIDINSGFIAIGVINEKSFISDNEITKNLTVNKIQEYIKGVMTEFKPCFISNFVSNKMIFVFPCNTEDRVYETKKYICEKLYKIKNSIENSFKVKMHFGIGDTYSSLHEIKNSYNQALTIVNNINSFGIDIVDYGDIKVEVINKFEYPYDMEKQIIEKVRLGITEEAIKAFIKIFDYTSERLEGNVKKVKFELLALYFALSRMIYELDKEDEELKDFILSKEAYYDANTLQEIYYIFEKDIRTISGKFREERNNISKRTLSYAIQYINENYMKDIKLEDVARQVHVSPNYFSRIFKTEYKQSFVEYLTRIRIEAAKKMILKADKSISDICWDVGYNDPNYFTKVFKKVTGQTPSEYREAKTNQRLFSNKL